MAVLLQARAYDLTTVSTPVAIDNIDLYGRGRAHTSLALPTTATVGAQAAVGETTTIADIAITGTLILVQGTGMVPLSLGQVDTVQEPGTAATAPSAAATAWEPATTASATGSLLQGYGLGLADASTRGTFVLNNVTLQGPSGIYSIASGADLYYLHLNNTAIDHGTNPLHIITTGGLVLNGATLSGSEVALGAYENSATITNSQITAEMVSVVADDGLTIAGSALAATNGGLILSGQSASAPVGGPVTVTGSSLTALDADLSDADALGIIVVITSEAPITLQDNMIIKAHNYISLAVLASLPGNSDITVSGNDLVEVGVLTADDPVNYQAGTIYIETHATGTPDNLVFENNGLRVNGMVRVWSDDNANIVFSDNTGIVGDDSIEGHVLLHVGYEGSVTMHGNDLHLSKMLEVTLNVSDGLVVTDNDIVIEANTDADALIRGFGGPCTITGNTFEVTNITGTHSARSRVECYSTGNVHDLQLNDNIFTMTGNPSSITSIEPYGLSEINIARNTFTGFTAVTGYIGGLLMNFTDNTLYAQGAAIRFQGADAVSLGQLNVLRNTITYTGDASGESIAIFEVLNTDISNNTISVGGTPSPEFTAFHIGSYNFDTLAYITNNTVTNGRRALRVEGHSVLQPNMDVIMNNNVFNFDFYGAPQVALLEAVGNLIDARHNVWGSITDVAVAQSYATVDAASVSMGAILLLDPLTMPTP